MEISQKFVAFSEYMNFTTFPSECNLRTVCKKVLAYLMVFFFLFQCLLILDRSDRLGIRREEFILLKAIIVSNCDVQLDEVASLRKLRDDLLASLHDCVAVIRYDIVYDIIYDIYDMMYDRYDSVSNCDVQLHEVASLRKLRDALLASLHDCVAVIRY